MQIQARYIDIDKQELFNRILSETLHKVYNPQNYSKESEDVLAKEYATTNIKDAQWFEEYLADACMEVSAKMRSLNKSDRPSYKINDENDADFPNSAWFLITVVPKYDSQELETLIKKCLKDYIVHRWYVMKGLYDIAGRYELDFQKSISRIFSIAKDGVDATPGNGFGSFRERNYNMGFGIAV